MARAFQNVKRSQPAIPAGLDMSAVVDHFENFYGEAIIALSDAIRARPGSAKHVSGYWHEPKNKVGLPAWEREFDKKFADRVDLILGIAVEFGLNRPMATIRVKMGHFALGKLANQSISLH